MIKINNKRDYLRFYWIFLLGMVLFATALMLAILRMSWLALLLYLILHYFFQKAFQLEMSIKNGHFQLRKTFLGLPYWQRKLELWQVIWDDAASKWILHGKNGRSFELMEDVLTQTSGLRVFDGKKSLIITDLAAAKSLLSALEVELKVEGVKVYYIS
jgi:hypothetical protein